MSVDANSVFSKTAGSSAGRHDSRIPEAKSDDDKTVLVQASMPLSQKTRFANAAKAHGLGLSAFVRLACDEYIRTHGWE